MALILTAQSPSQAQTQYVLTQAQYHALVHGFKTVMKFAPSAIVVLDSVLYALSASRKLLLKADYSRLIVQPVTMAVVPDKVAIKEMGLICASDVCISLNNGRYAIDGEPTGTDLEAMAMPGPNTFKLPGIAWIGTEVAGYDPKLLKTFIGQKSNAVELAIYFGQLERAGVKGRKRPFTFTQGMVASLAGHQPGTVLLSREAFRHFGEKQSLHVGQASGQYILKVTNLLDIGVDLVAFEYLEGIRTAGVVPA